MFSGVSKSGSPRAKSRTSTPSAFSRLASAAIARVADGAIRFERSASVRAIATSEAYRTRRGQSKERSGTTAYQPIMRPDHEMHLSRR